MLLRRALLSALPGTIALTAPKPGRAQSGAAFPSRPIRLIAPFPPGGGVDVTARLIAVPLGAALGQPVVVENRPGAGGSIGAAEVARAAPDGHTLLMDSISHTINPALLHGLTFDYATAFAPVSQVVLVPQMVAVHPDLPVRTLREFVSYAQGRPGALTYGSAGNATASHLCMVLLCRRNGLDMVHAPYRGGLPALQDVMAGRVTTMVSAAPYTLALARDGRVKVLAVTTAERLPSLPDVPTFAEEGFGAERVSEWNGLFATAGTPADVIAKVQRIVHGGVMDPDMQRRLDGLGVTPVGSDPATFAREVREQREAMGQLVRDAHIELG